MIASMPSPNRMTTSLDRQLAAYGPLMRVRDVCIILQASSDYVDDLIDAGRLRAVDISRPGSALRCVRVYRFTLEGFLRGSLPDYAVDPVSIAMFHGRETWLRREVERLLDCSSDHVRNLALKGPCNGTATGGRTHRVYASSIVSFLSAREVR